MIKKVDSMQIYTVFDINNNTIYKIPKYQREYTWGTREWDALFNDVLENEMGYFLGSYICVNTSSINGTVLEVIDGQQRFTSITLLLAALYSKLLKLKSSMDDDELNDLFNLRNVLANKYQTCTSANMKKTEYRQRLLLQKQNCNDEDYSYILYDNGIITTSTSKPLNFGNRRIAKAYRHFDKLIEEKLIETKTEDSNISDIQILFSIVRKFEFAVLVGIEVDTNKDAYMLFESLNHRGVPLSALDLIKNTLISQSEVSMDTDNTYEQWKQILDFISPDDYSVQERFFRQYYNAFRDELNANYKSSDKMYYFGYLATRTTILDIYEKLIKADYHKLLSDLTEKAQKYALIVNNSDEHFSYTESLQNLARISGAPSYILLLYLLSNQTELSLSDDDIDLIIKTLIIFFVRRNLTDVPNTRKLTQLFIDIIAEIKVLKGLDIVTKIHDMLKNISAAEDIFKKQLCGPIYDENPDVTRFILCDIENQHTTKEIHTDLWARDSSNKYIWTIEHIFPEGENIPECWVKMIAAGNKEKAQELRVKYVHTIGNLTLTGYNQNLSNMSFEQKKDRKSKDKSKDIGYKNGLFLNQDIVKEITWTIQKIEDRTNTLLPLILKMYQW